MYRRIIGILFLFLICEPLYSQSIKWTRLCVDSDGNTLLEWKWNSFKPSGVKYDLFYASQVDGVYNSLSGLTLSGDSILFTSVKASDRALFFYVRASWQSGSLVSDTVSTIYLEMENRGGCVANITWTRPFYSSDMSDLAIKYLLSCYSGSKGRVEQTTRMFYQDTVTVCGDTLNYWVSADYAGCKFKSNTRKDYFFDFTPPDTAKLDSVSLNPNTHFCEMGWQPSASTDVFAYVTYVYKDGIWQVMDTLYGAEKTYYVDSLNNDGTIRQYRVAAIDTCRNASPLGEVHHTLKLSVAVDKCDSFVNLSWNSYDNMPGGVASFEVFSNEENGGFKKIYEEKSNSCFCKIERLNVLHDFVFYVRVKNPDGSSSSTSTFAEAKFNRTISSGKVYLKSVSVLEDESVEITGFVKDTVLFTHVHLYMSDSPGGEMKLINTWTKSGEDYIFNRKNLDVNNNVYGFKFAITDECDRIFEYSDLAYNIFLRGENAEDDNKLNWTAYSGFGRDPDAYRIYRRTETESDFVLLTALSSSQLSYTENTWNQADKSAIYKYKVSAFGNNADLSSKSECFSNNISLQNTPSTYIPNSFVPDSEIEENRLFKPVNTYVDATEYTFVIFDRWGQVVFKTHKPDEGWDGNINGKAAKMGIYVYQLTYRIDSKNLYSARGMVNLIR